MSSTKVTSNGVDRRSASASTFSAPIAVLAISAIFMAPAARSQQAEIHHGDSNEHGQTFHSLERFTVSFRTDGEVPDNEVETVYVTFNPDSSGAASNNQRSGFGVGCSASTPLTPLTAKDGKLTCSGLMIPGNLESGKYVLTGLNLIQAKTNHGHFFEIPPIRIDVINTQEESMKHFDGNRLQDVTVGKE